MKAFNAVVEDYKLGFDDYGHFTVDIHLKTTIGDVGIFNSINLGYKEPMYNREYADNGLGNYLGYFLAKIMEVFNVNELDDIVGRPCRAVFKNSGHMGDTCIGIQNFLEAGVFFIPSLTEDDNISGILEDDEELQKMYEKCKKDCIIRQNIWKSIREVKKDN